MKYCKNCRYKKSSEFCVYSPEYQYEKIGSEFCGFFKKKIRQKENALFPAYRWELNKEGRCSYYKKKRWKFWIK